MRAGKMNFTPLNTLRPKYGLKRSFKSGKGQCFFTVPTVHVGHFNFSMKMQASFKHGSCFGEFGCKTPQQLYSLSNTVDMRHRLCRIIASLRNVDTFFYRDVSTFCCRLKTRFLEDVVYSVLITLKD